MQNTSTSTAMLLSIGSSFGRRPNGRVIILACLASYCGYHVGRQSLSRSSTSTQNEERWPKPTLNRVQAVTVTVQAPQATVTVTTEVLVPKAESEEPLVVERTSDDSVPRYAIVSLP